MCGICGFTWSDESLIEQMAAILSHRGPDQKGKLIDDHISLGHRRLSIIDLSERGRQPLHNEDESIFIVHNGEVYNFKALRGLLENKGHTFYSDTDTEVIVHAYEQWGPDCVRRLRGMFAFAVWDSNKQELFLARDRLGIKPLFYFFDAPVFIFASEIKSILLAPQIKREVDPTALYHYLGYEYVPAPLTMFKGIKKVLPGHTLTYKEGAIATQRYWELSFTDTRHDENYYATRIYNLLKESVESRLVSDVPIGAFLSGGIDSSAIVGFMSQRMDEPVKTFSIGYEDETFSEFEYAQQVSDLFGTDHTEILIDPYSMDLYENIIWHLDEPMSEFSLLPVYIFCQHARKDVTVSLSGEGGDELFAGYERFIASRLDTYYQKLPNTVRRNVVSTIVNKLPPQPQKKGVINLMKRFIEGSDRPIQGRQMRWQYFSDSSEEKKLYSTSFTSQIESPTPLYSVDKYFQSCNIHDTVNREIFVEMKTYLVDNVLVKVDRMSMAHSLEVRVPYLDHLLVEFCATVPGDLKLKGLTTKYIFKKAMARLLPINIIHRPKQGYSFPIKNWLRTALKDYMMDLLEHSAIIKHYFNTSYLSKLIEQHIRGTHNHSHRLWSLMTLELWHRKFFGGDVEAL